MKWSHEMDDENWIYTGMQNRLTKVGYVDTGLNWLEKNTAQDTTHLSIGVLKTTLPTSSLLDN